MSGVHHDSTIRLPAYTELTLLYIRSKLNTNFIFVLTNVPRIVVVIHRYFPCIIPITIIAVIIISCRYA